MNQANIAIIFAGGLGTRLKNAIPKQFLEIEGKPILIHTLLNFQNHPEIDKIYISILAEYLDYTKDLIKKYNISKAASVVEGGSSAMESIYKALIEARKENLGDSIVLIHDGVRPVITDEVISKNIETVKKYKTAITAIPCNETILISKDGITPNIVPIRKETFKAQAPQGFLLDEIIEAHNSVKSYENIVDNCTLYKTLGKNVHLIKGNFGNIKVTTKEDIYILKGILDFIKENNDNIG